ncbi:TetR/AcrR family transcriptional regulator [Hymenobacter humi]|uniref:TetR/AcrR family transcriptional regulator n=1 Tax=Hymenobacter humi TaxID=1411620 RepID=A0ABW2U8N7_9BACT
MTAQVTSATPSPDTRTRIVDLAENLLLERGFNAFSYQHIARKLGVKPAAIHYHFPSKDDLGTAIVARQLRRLRKWRDLPRVADLPPAEQARSPVCGVRQPRSPGVPRVPVWCAGRRFSDPSCPHASRAAHL